MTRLKGVIVMRALVVYESMYGNTHVDGEASWARRWGMIVAAASKTYLPATHETGPKGM
jgi:hypothetical protein